MLPCNKIPIAYLGNKTFETKICKEKKKRDKEKFTINKALYLSTP